MPPLPVSHRWTCQSLKMSVPVCACTKRYVCSAQGCTPPPSSTYLCEKDAVKELVGFLLVLGDVSISVHAKHLRVRVNWKRPDILQISVILGNGRRKLIKWDHTHGHTHISIWRADVDPTGRIVVLILLNQLWIVELVQYTCQGSSVPVISDPASIVTLAC